MADFPETQWSQILALQNAEGQVDAKQRRRALLDQLIGAYWSPVYHYVRALDRRAPGDAEDTTQQFFAMVLDRGDLQKVSSERGSFRGYLKTAIKHFVVDKKRSEAARGRVFAFQEAEQQWAEAPVDDPEKAFDREWVRLVLTTAVAQLGQALRTEGRARQAEMFEAYCLGDDESVSYKSLAQRYGTNLDEVRNGLRSARQRLRKILRQQLRAYLGPGDDLETELRFIVADL